MAAASATGQGATGLRVLVVDHRRAVGESLAERLAREADVVFVGVAESSEAAQGALDEVHPTVGTVAFDLEDGGGLVLITQARRSHPAVRWVVVGGGGEPLDLADAVAAGASGYVTMESPAAALAEALRGAVAGLAITPDDLLRQVINELDARGNNVKDIRSGRPPLRRIPSTTWQP